MRSSSNIIQPGLTQTHSAYTQQCAAWWGGWPWQRACCLKGCCHAVTRQQEENTVNSTHGLRRPTVHTKGLTAEEW